jgi:hypothetical protein
MGAASEWRASCTHPQDTTCRCAAVPTSLFARRCPRHTHPSFGRLWPGQQWGSAVTDHAEPMPHPRPHHKRSRSLALRSGQVRLSTPRGSMLATSSRPPTDPSPSPPALPSATMYYLRLDYPSVGRMVWCLLSWCCNSLAWELSEFAAAFYLTIHGPPQPDILDPPLPHPHDIIITAHQSGLLPTFAFSFSHQIPRKSS